ncbi:hypothetical protein [Piscinibacter gummiphilus]|uniref:Uncharacterized protein n=1 Tax=Piscinibacter gummiphilus TaxID=946333 RepID=A0A1W6LBK8_9BURK|nr:hypothetical protein [Piscinibacter gummiphilus]ARN21649.1 hypothetical protein A4W93_18085 [Piscinibacter gummiphilus]ATU66337.1 hypothetical protein CPZ87_18175 [Piscinibacter gummiphilus]GLS95784.1 hypothetical protein GCM10007918_30760 [Piscinibacter gummiphilus]
MTTHVESTDLDPLMQGEATAPDTTPLSPQARVDASRAALQHWVLRTYHPELLPPPPPGESPVPPADGSDPPWLGAFIDAVNDVPVAAVAVRYMRRWWARHPWRATAQLADEAGRELLRPIAKRHPWMLLGGAVVAGIVIGRLRPWRLVSRNAVLASLLPPISFASLMTSITAMFGSVASAPEAPAEPGAAPADDTAADPS